MIPINIRKLSKLAAWLDLPSPSLWPCYRSLGSSVTWQESYEQHDGDTREPCSSEKYISSGTSLNPPPSLWKDHLRQIHRTAKAGPRSIFFGSSEGWYQLSVKVRTKSVSEPAVKWERGDSVMSVSHHRVPARHAPVFGREIQHKVDTWLSHLVLSNYRGRWKWQFWFNLQLSQPVKTIGSQGVGWVLVFWAWERVLSFFFAAHVSSSSDPIVLWWRYYKSRKHCLWPRSLAVRSGSPSGQSHTQLLAQKERDESSRNEMFWIQCFLPLPYPEKNWAMLLQLLKSLICPPLKRCHFILGYFSGFTFLCCFLIDLR